MNLSRRQIIATATATLAASASSFAAAPVYPKLKRGVNIHHLLNWPDSTSTDGAVNYLWPPFQGPRFEISDSELRTLATSGFDFIRLTVDPSIFITASADHAAALEQHAKATINQLLNSGFNVVFDLHPVAINPVYAPLSLVDSEQSPAFQAYAEFVGRAASMLRDYPANRIALELMNEPLIFGRSRATISKWQSMLEHLHRQARAKAETLPIVLTGAGSSNRKALNLLDLTPFRHSNVLYTFHFYEPYCFTHQGVREIEPQFISGLVWPEDNENVKEVHARAQSALAASTLDGKVKTKAETDNDRLLDDYVRQHYDLAKVKGSLDEVAQWARDSGVDTTRLLLGEFGCVISSAGHSTGESRLNWLREVVSSAERNGIAWAYWAYKGNGGMQLLENGRVDLETLRSLMTSASR